ncbi:ATP-binding cassette domain-containing protein [Synechococcus sp. Nb3U1]|uniref:ATP-binding cassette domain-containing protein n=1 Tax=Synechococcus sp. Nb3U1 TaxID=1914529 RepID=UPI001F46A57B|nr:ATP-binding cassette domain-containing protein [Synechococcus sp. Nb3U1]MCF2970814.1 ATP-binding cassette domain-containing protein [Synechococcus sp. Nb3U1]
MSDWPLFELEQFGIQVRGRTLLHGVSCRIPERQITAILGPERSGKTLLLHGLNGFMALLATQPDCSIQTMGTLCYRGYPLACGFGVRSGAIALVVPRVFPGSIFANVAYGVRAQGQRTERLYLEEWVAKCLTWVGLDDLVARWQDSADLLSPGEQQQLALARGLAIRPEVLLLDEPWTGLDAVTQEHLSQLLRSLRQRCALVVTSRRYQAAVRIADWLLLLEREEEGGRFVAAGSPQELLMTPPSRVVQDYLSRYMRT